MSTRAKDGLDPSVMYTHNELDAARNRTWTEAYAAGLALAVQRLREMAAGWIDEQGKDALNFAANTLEREGKGE